MQKNKRLACFDIIKGICIIAVVLLHSEYDFYFSTFLPLWGLLGNSWHVGVFFVVSGFFLKNEYIESPKVFLVKRVAKMYFKLIICYIPFILLHNFFINTGIYSTEIMYGAKQISLYSIADIAKNIVIAILGGGREPLLAPLWFIYCLCASYVTIAFLSFACRRLPWKRLDVLMVSILFVGTCVMHILDLFFNIHIPRYANIFAIALLVHIGYLIRRYNICQRINFRWFLFFVLSFYLCVICCGPNLMIKNEYYSVPSMLLCIVSAFFSLYYISIRTEENLLSKSLAFIGKHTFAVMVWHLSAFKIATLLLNLFGYNAPIYILESYASSVIFLLIYTIIGIMVPVLMDKVYETIKIKIRQ